MAGLIVVALLLLFNFTGSYFSYTLHDGRVIRLKSVVTFYGSGTVLFAFAYYFAFLAEPALFEYDAERIHWFASIGQHGLKPWLTKPFFILYSALKSVGISVAYLESKSVLIAMLNYLQALYTFCLVSLLVAGYVNQKSRKDA